ncbi:hypothetical protein BGW36DRAFT_289483 [Talaromyces proteolyticus]|uniref:polynucleotide adenylyltransferase n=1 Tax=Talaromyces proteolyticus TaxID=1131652 RepID=A0AAD4Q459_9EURO|nr:uncharacterized protein BGW36DRAFT_289483 [Talaromyces proteolyticus]KAH8702411.1 hypothetical protein BGW36DRAFT_289483 [Talaromyces proteolyticus]
MEWHLSTESSASNANMSSRPPLTSQQSNSLPSTPYQHTRGLSFHSRSPSPRRRSTSPHSTHSEINPLPSFRKPLGGCKYETGMAFFRRRMPYSLGGDLLPQEKLGIKQKLESEEEEKLSADMQALFTQLLPSTESDDRRRQLVQKLETLFNDQWPGNNIKVHVFGSSGNKLCSSDSDVDICITTSFKELENVCLLAEVLANHGMERVVCVSHAKVPIVKIWDPQLKMACDMNVNNTLALENTRMIRTYVDVDERVRPLAMIVKHWTKRRVLNDAALGGTLSSYTWICLIINFLQTRDPPLLPSLQNRPHKTKKVIDGVEVSFDDDLDSLQGFGNENKQTLGQLLFQFFRYYGHEVDYEKSAISVREGKLISKEGKGWHLLQNNRLCVEEPFNTTRNLGNTADDTSFRGLHMELRRAFKAISEVNLEKCCEQYVFPPEEERVWERPPPQPRPILTPTSSHPSSRGGRGSGRGARHSNQYGRGGSNSARRSSSATNRSSNGNFRPHHVQVNPDMNIHAQQAQYLLHDQLYQQIQILQAQEQELRMQLHNQSLLTGRAPPVLIRQPLIQFSFPQQEVPADDNARARAGTVNHPPLGSLRPGMFYNPAYLPLATQSVQGSNTNPSSPSLSSAVPDLQRNPRRSSIANGSPSGSLRSHSQPARPVHSPVMQNFAALYSPVPLNDGSRDRFQPGSPSRSTTETDSTLQSPSLSAMPASALLEEHRPSEYFGFYVTPQQYQQTLMAMPMPAAAYPQTPVDYRHTALAYPDPFGAYPLPNGQAVSPSMVSTPRQATVRDRGPLIIDGSVPPQDPKTSSQGDYTDQYSNLAASVPSDVETGWESPSRASDALSAGAQEPTTFEMDPLSSTNSIHHTAGGLDSGLSNQLQGLQVSRSDGIDDVQSVRDRKVTKPGQLNGESPTKPPAHQRQSKSPEKLSATGNPHSNKESSPTSPTTKSRTNGLESDKVNGVNHKIKAKSAQEPQPVPSVSLLSKRDTQPASLPRKPEVLPPIHNGRDSGNTNMNGGWQTTKKKHKRNAKSMAEVQQTNMGESFPLEESLRKGG